MLGIETKVIRGQSLTVSGCLELKPRFVVIGPGPGTPSQATLSKELIHVCAGYLPLLGICLGHQALAEFYGGRVGLAKVPMHGKTSQIYHNGQGLFRGIPQGFTATRYHSLIVEDYNLPDCLEVTGRTESQEIMGLRHRHFQMESIQFHPESILTEHGLSMLRNFVE